MSKIFEDISLDECIKDCLRGQFDMYEDTYPHDFCEEYVPYGDTFVSLGSEITPKSQLRCLEEFKEDFDFDTFIELLAEHTEFKFKILDLVEKGDF